MEQENLYRKIKQDFYYRYTKYAVPVISDYEGERKLHLFFALFFSSILIILGIVILILMLSYSNRIDIRGPVLTIVFGFIPYNAIKKRFEAKIKKKVMPIVCGCFPKLKWRDQVNKKQKLMTSKDFSVDFQTENYKLSNIIPNFHRMFFDDCFDGEYNDTKFAIEENYAEIGSGKNRHTVFKGVIITLDMNKPFHGNTVIKPDSMFHTSPSGNLHYTVLEDVEFEKKFDVFTDDDIEARYLITPSLMERLKSMQVAFKADKVSASFYQNKFYIALHTRKDLFSLGSLTKNVCDKEQFFTMFEEIFSIIKLIDHFKLNQKIGL